MTLRDWLIEGFSYDSWANRLWIDAYPQMPEPRVAEEILEHVLWAEEIWISRMHPELPEGSGELGARLAHVAEQWKQIVSTEDPSTRITYKNTKGVQYERELGAIALHVINHGTHHRGALRGLAAEQGFLDFPETDLMIFWAENHRYGS